MAPFNSTQILKKVKNIELLNDLDTVWLEFISMARSLGFDSVAYYRSNQQAHYFNNTDLHFDKIKSSSKMLIKQCCHNYETTFIGVEFFDSQYTIGLPSYAHTLSEHAPASDIVSGVAIPLTLAKNDEGAMIVLCSRLLRAEFEDLCHQILKTFQMACFLVHRHIEALLTKQLKGTRSIEINPFKTQTMADQPLPKPDELKTLTPRENDILHHIASGQSRKKCAHTLHLAESTISTHLKNIYKKLGVNNRVQASNAISQNSTLAT